MGFSAIMDHRYRYVTPLSLGFRSFSRTDALRSTDFVVEFNSFWGSPRSFYALIVRWKVLVYIFLGYCVYNNENYNRRVDIRTMQNPFEQEGFLHSDKIYVVPWRMKDDQREREVCDVCDGRPHSKSHCDHRRSD